MSATTPMPASKAMVWGAGEDVGIPKPRVLRPPSTGIHCARFRQLPLFGIATRWIGHLGFRRHHFAKGARPGTHVKHCGEAA